MMGPQMTQMFADFYGLKDGAQSECAAILGAASIPHDLAARKQNHLRRSADDPAFLFDHL